MIHRRFAEIVAGSDAYTLVQRIERKTPSGPAKFERRFSGNLVLQFKVSKADHSDLVCVDHEINQAGLIQDLEVVY